MNWWHRHHLDHHRHDPQPESVLYLIEPPQDDVVSLAEMKAHLRVEHDDDNDLIEALTEAVTQHLDGRDGKLGRALVDQTWELRMAWFPRVVSLRLPPLIEVEAVDYLDSSGARHTFDTENYLVTGIGDRGHVHLAPGQCWPVLPYDRPECAIVRFRAGYLDGGVSPAVANVPGPIKAAIKLMTGTLYQNRENVIVGQTAIEIPWAAEALLASYRVFT
jgi:uncharacterized phiE125 gp8 family phage protein